MYVVDDDDDFRKSLLVLLNVAGWKSQGFASVDDFREECAHLAPGILLLDIRMPGTGGLEFLESEDRCLEHFAVVVVTGHGDVDTAVRSLKCGALDFIEKPFSGSDIMQTLESGYSSFLETIEASQREKIACQKVGRLSGRERDVLSGLLAGASHKEIARHFGISDRTVEMYRNNLVRKLDADTTTEALRIGVLAKLAPAPIARLPGSGASSR